MFPNVDLMFSNEQISDVIRSFQPKQHIPKYTPVPENTQYLSSLFTIIIHMQWLPLVKMPGQPPDLHAPPFPRSDVTGATVTLSSMDGNLSCRLGGVIKNNIFTLRFFKTSVIFFYQMQIFLINELSPFAAKKSKICILEKI